MKIKDIMTADVQIISPTATVREAARKMGKNDIGAIPVCDGRKVIGIVTDRDITIQAVSRGLDPDQCTVNEVMSSPVIWCFEDRDIDEAARLMESCQIRRLVVVNRDKKLVGIVSLGDLATRANDRLAGETLEKVSEPAHPVH